MKTSLIIKGLTPGLTEAGKIKIGEKGRMITSAKGTAFQPPTKLDHFRVTTLERGADGNYITDMGVHRLYGDKPRSLPIRLLYDDVDLNFQCRYACFRGRSMWCSGDGEIAIRINGNTQEVPCPCGRQAPDYKAEDRCKINARLSVIIDGMDRVGGVWVLRSTSYNTTVGILSSLALIKRITGGPLAGLPLELTLNPKTVVDPNGKIQTIWVVGLQFKGSIEQLQQIGLEQAKRDALHYARIERIEVEARALLAHNPVMIDNAEADDVVEEFYPEQVQQSSHVETPLPPVETQATKEPETTQPENTETKRGPQNAEASSGGRRRTKKFAVDPEAWNGKTEIATCGSTPEQLAALRELSREPEIKKRIMAFMAAIGFDQLSFLRLEEAAQLLVELQPKTANGYTEAPKDAAPPDDLVPCPLREGDRMSVSQFCHTICEDRQKFGFCPSCGDPIPDSMSI